MNMRSPTQTKAEPSFTPVQTGLLQRQCASCGQHTIAGGECAECKNKRSTLQHHAVNQLEQSKVPPISGESVQLSNQVLNAETRELVRQYFDHDFSTTPVKSESSAQRFLRRQTSSAPTETATTSGNDDFLRSHFCINPPNPSNPTRKPFTNREERLANFGLWNARSIADRAFMNLGHHDPYHLRMAERAFGRPVTFDVLNQHIRRIYSVLSSLHISQNLFAATCDDPYCNRNSLAYTLDDLSAVVLCPFYFIQPPRTLAINLLHEAGHMARIDVNWAPGNERYCRLDDIIECDNICPLSGGNLLENVDAWARFLYCLSASS